MTIVGRIREIVCYPVKSMAGTPVAEAFLGWHGLAGDRRFAFRRAGDGSAFPFLTAGRLPQLVAYQPVDVDESSGEPVPANVRTPSGAIFGLGSSELAAELSQRFGSGVELMRFKNGIFDDGTLSIIALPTINAIGAEAGVELDPRRFRANVLLDTDSSEAFAEDAWLGSVLVFGDGDDAPAVSVTVRDERCMMINLDPDTGVQDARVMKAAVRLNGNNAGVYASVVRTGTIRVGDVVRLAPAT